MRGIGWRKCRRHFLLIKKPAGMGDGARGEEGNAAFASEPFPSSPRHGFRVVSNRFKNNYFARIQILLFFCESFLFFIKRSFLPSSFLQKKHAPYFGSCFFIISSAVPLMVLLGSSSSAASAYSLFLFSQRVFSASIPPADRGLPFCASSSSGRLIQ